MVVNLVMHKMNRRYFMRLLAGAGAAMAGFGKPAFAMAEGVRGPSLPWARLKFPCRGGDRDDWNVHPQGDLNLINEMRIKASLNVEQHWYVADSAKLEAMTPFPFIFMHAELAPNLGETDVANLREYLLRGGFLFAEDCVNGKIRGLSSNGTGDEFFRRMRDIEFPRILPKARLEKLPDDHPVFHCFYHFSNGLPHMQGVPHGLHGLMQDGRLLALLSPSDLHCGWTNGEQWFGHKKHVESLQMGTNIYVFAMTKGGAVNPSPTSAPKGSAVGG